MSNETKKAPPAAKFRLGRVQADIWAKVTDKGTFFEPSIYSTYKDRNGKWQKTYSYDFAGLLALPHVSRWVTDKIIELRAADTGDTATAALDTAEPEDDIAM